MGAAAATDNDFAQVLTDLQALNSNVTVRLVRQNALGQRETVGFWRERPVEDVFNAEEWIPEWSGGGSYQLQVSLPGAVKKVLTTRTINLPGDSIEPMNIRQRREAADATRRANASMQGALPTVLPPGSVVMGADGRSIATVAGGAAVPLAFAAAPSDPEPFGGGFRPRHFEPRAPTPSQEDTGMSRLLEKLIDARLSTPDASSTVQQQREQDRRDWEKRLEDERRRWETQAEDNRKAREAQEREWQKQREDDRKAREEETRLAREHRAEEERKRYDTELQRERERREEEAKRREREMEEKLAREHEKAQADLKEARAASDAKLAEFKAQLDKMEDERRRREDEARRREEELKQRHDQALTAAKEQHTQTLAAIEKKQAEDKTAGLIKDFQTQVLALIDKMNVNKVDPSTTSQAELFKLLTVLLSKDDGRGDMMKTLLEVLSPERSMAAMESVARLSTASTDAMLGILKSDLLDRLSGSAPQSPWLPFVEKLVDGLGAVGEAALNARAANVQQQQAAVQALARGGVPSMPLPGLPSGRQPPVPQPPAAFGGQPAPQPAAAPLRTVRLPEAPMPRAVPAAPVAPSPAAAPQTVRQSEAAAPLAKIGRAIVQGAPPDEVAGMLVDYVVFMHKFDLLSEEAEEIIFTKPAEAVPRLLATALSLVPNAPQALDEAYVDTVIRTFAAALQEVVAEEAADEEEAREQAGPGNGDEAVSADGGAAAAVPEAATPEAVAAPEAAAAAAEPEPPPLEPEPPPEPAPPAPPPAALPRRPVVRRT